MFAQILVVMIVAIAIAALAERRNAQPALLVAMVGLAASFIPGLHRLELAPEIILGVFLPPMLFSAASDFSLSSFAKRLGSIVNLGVFMVFATAGLVGILANMLVPGLGSAALVLGAVLAPPDAVAAISIGRKAGLPTAVMTVLKGESLINDAAALTLFTVAVAAVTGTHSFIDSTPLYFLYAALLGTLVGMGIGHLARIARHKLTNPSLATAISVIVPFAAYLLAEELHASGVLAVVAAGFALGHHATEAGFAERMQERSFWRTIDTLLETFVFAYIGLQLRFVIGDAAAAGYAIWQLLAASAALRHCPGRPLASSPPGCPARPDQGSPAERQQTALPHPAATPGLEGKPRRRLDRHARRCHPRRRGRYSGRHRERRGFPRPPRHPGHCLFRHHRHPGHSGTQPALADPRPQAGRQR